MCQLMPTDHMRYHSVNNHNLNRIDKSKFFRYNTQTIKLWEKEKAIILKGYKILLRCQFDVETRYI